MKNEKGKGVTLVDGISDEKDFQDLENAYRILNFPPEVVQTVFKVIAGVLHFGNVKFKAIDAGGDEGSEIDTGTLE